MSNFLDAIQQAQSHEPKQQHHITIKKTKLARKMKLEQKQEEDAKRNIGACKFIDFNQEFERNLQSLALQGMKMFQDQQEEQELEQNKTGQNQQELVYERTTWKVLEDSD